MQTRIFKSGNSLAVRIPKELAFAGAAQDVDIERQGDILVIRPVTCGNLAGIGDIFSMFSADFMAGGRESNEQADRNWNV